jgi:hypothetical protein
MAPLVHLVPDQPDVFRFADGGWVRKAAGPDSCGKGQRRSTVLDKQSPLKKELNFLAEMNAPIDRSHQGGHIHI